MKRKDSNFFEISSIILFGADEEDDVVKVLKSSLPSNNHDNKIKNLTKKNTLLIKEEDVNDLQKVDNAKRYSMF
jgi:hypothetical protein